MKIVLRDVPPLTFRAVCLLAGGLGMLFVAQLDRRSWAIPRGYRLRLLVLSACNIVGWNVLVIYGIALMPSGRAALLAYTMPLWSVWLSAWLLHERLIWARVVALALGMVGVALILGAAASWGLGVVLLKRFAVPMPTTSLTGSMMLSGAIPIAAAALALEHDQWRPVGLYPALGVLYSVFIAFMFCYWAWNRIVLMVPVAVASLSSLVTPVVGVLSGMWLLHERLSWRELAAGALILSAVALVRRPAKRAPPATVVHKPVV